MIDSSTSTEKMEVEKGKSDELQGMEVTDLGRTQTSPGDMEDESDSSSTDAEDELEEADLLLLQQAGEEAEKGLVQKIEANPRDKESYVKLIKLYKNNNDGSKLQQVRTAFRKNLILPEEEWMSWLDDAITRCEELGTEDVFADVVFIYQAAVIDHYSTTVAERLLSFAYCSITLSSAKRLKTLKMVLDDFGYHLSLEEEQWKRWMEIIKKAELPAAELKSVVELLCNYPIPEIIIKALSPVEASLSSSSLRTVFSGMRSSREKLEASLTRTDSNRMNHNLRGYFEYVFFEVSAKKEAKVASELAKVNHLVSLFRRFLAAFPTNCDVCFLCVWFVCWSITQLSKKLKASSHPLSESLVNDIAAVFMRLLGILGTMHRGGSKYAEQNEFWEVYMLTFTTAALFNQDLSSQAITPEVTRDIKAFILAHEISLESILQSGLGLLTRTATIASDDSNAVFRMLKFYLQCYKCYMFPTLSKTLSKEDVAQKLKVICDYVKAEVTRRYPTNLNLQRQAAMCWIETDYFIQKSPTTAKVRADAEDEFRQNVLQTLETEVYLHGYLLVLDFCAAKDEIELYRTVCKLVFQNLKDEFSSVRVICNRWEAVERVRTHSAFDILSCLSAVNRQYLHRLRTKLRSIEHIHETSDYILFLKRTENERQKKSSNQKQQTKGSMKRKVNVLSGTNNSKRKDIKVDSESSKAGRMLVMKKKVFIYNLDYGTSQEELVACLQERGITAKDVKLLAGRNRGQAVVDLEVREKSGETNLEEMIAKTNDLTLRNRILSVTPYLSKKERKAEKAPSNGKPKQDLNVSKEKPENRLVVKNLLPVVVEAFRDFETSTNEFVQEVRNAGQVVEVSVSANGATVFVTCEDKDSAQSVMSLLQKNTSLSDSYCKPGKALVIEQFTKAGGKGTKLQKAGVANEKPRKAKEVNSRRRQVLKLEPAAFSSKQQETSESAEPMNARASTSERKDNNYFKSLFEKK